MSYETVNLTIEGGIGHLELNRPDDANALNLQLAQDYMNAAIELSTTPGVDPRSVTLVRCSAAFR